MKNVSTNKRSLLYLLTSLTFGVLFGFLILLTPKPAEAYIAPGGLKGPLYGADNGNGSWTYCCGDTSDYKCSGSVAC